MKKFLAVLTLLIGFQTNAGPITISSDQDTTDIGDTVNITLTGSGMGAFDFFTLDFVFDTSIYSFLPSSLSSDLDLLDAVWPGEGLTATSKPASGIFFNLYQWDEYISAGQDFVLASFELTAIAAGASTFSFGDSYFAGSNGAVTVGLDSVLTTQVISTSTAVPEPSTLAIFALGLMGVVARRVNKQK
jgi:hypothetical protein